MDENEKEKVQAIEPEPVEPLEEKAITAEELEAYFETDEGKKVYQMTVEPFVVDGVKCYEENHLQEFITEHEQKMSDPMYQQLVELERAIALEDHKAKVLEAVASTKMLPIGLADVLVNMDTEKALNTIDRMVEQLKVTLPQAVKQEVNKRIGR